MNSGVVIKFVFLDIFILDREFTINIVPSIMFSTSSSYVYLNKYILFKISHQVSVLHNNFDYQTNFSSHQVA